MRLSLIFQFLLLTQILSAQTFSEVMGTPFEGVQLSSIAFANVDGDNDQDVFITGRNSLGAYIAKLYTNDGLGNFSEVTGTPFEGFAVNSFAFADVDGDNDQDLLISGTPNLGTTTSKLYINDGMGNFSEATSPSFDAVNGGAMAFADVDGDNDQDVIITGIPNSGNWFSKLYTNDGMGNFSEVTGTPFEGGQLSVIAFADVDGDNDKDVLISGITSLGTPTSDLYVNDGAGNFSVALGIPFESVRVRTIAFADADGDNDQDVFITGLNNSGVWISKLYVNDGTGNFSEAAGTPLEGVEFGSMAFADVDGDTDQDVLITGRPNSGIWISKLYTNDGTGNFSEVIDTPFEGVERGSLAFADVDGDNDQDVLITGISNLGGPISKLYINDGAASSTDDLIIGINQDFTFYPNPLKASNLNITYQSAENGLVTIMMFDLNGHLLIQQKEFVGIGQHTFTVDIASLIPGSYILQLNDGERKGIVKFIVQ